MIFDNIKRICDIKGVSISAVEKQAGLSNSAIRKWNTSSPTIDNLMSVAKILDVTIDELLFER